MAACAALASLALPGAAAPATTAPALGVALPGHVPPLVAGSALEGPVLGAQMMSLAISLPVQDPAGLDLALNALYDPASPAYHQYLTPAQFADRFSPTQAQYDAASAYLQSKGLTVTGTHSGRLLLDVRGAAQTVEAAFGVHLGRYLAPSGREFFAPDADPTVDPAVAGLISGVIGLDDTAVGQAAAGPATPADGSSGAGGTGSGPYNGFTPGDIRQAYNLSPLPANGAGQSIALFEANGFYQSDITAFENYNGLPNIYPTVFKVAGSTGQPFDDPNAAGHTEATGDIEMAMALAPNLANIYVYEVPDNIKTLASDWADGYMQIADDNLAKQVSTSWFAGAEGSAPRSLVISENTIFEKMMMQGQTLFAASGDRGPFADGQNLGVYEVSGQPWACSVGGTTLTLGTTPQGAKFYAGEVTWEGMTYPVTSNTGGSGGGVSGSWPIPAWQAPRVVASTASNSAGNNINAFNYRNVPDVALNADTKNSPYSLYFSPPGPNVPAAGWYTNGGTSYAAPLWASFTALANQLRAAGNTPPIGQINPLLYAIGTAQYLYETGQSSQPVADFQDIRDGSVNINSSVRDAAVTGFDDATGWGSFNGANLLADLVHPPAYAAAPPPQPFYRLLQSGAQTGTDTYYDTKMDPVDTLITQSWTYIGVIGFAYNFQSDAPGLVPLYKLVRQTPYQDYFFTTSVAEKNAATNSGYYADGGVQCYVFPDGSGPGTVGVYRGFDRHGHHVFTTSPSEAAGWTGPPNYTNENIQFYILAR